MTNPGRGFDIEKNGTKFFFTNLLRNNKSNFSKETEQNETVPIGWKKPLHDHEFNL